MCTLLFYITISLDVGLGKLEKNVIRIIDTKTVGVHNFLEANAIPYRTFYWYKIIQESTNQTTPNAPYPIAFSCFHADPDQATGDQVCCEDTSRPCRGDTSTRSSSR